MSHAIHWLATAVLISILATHLSSAEICGVTVTPHVVADSMMYRRLRDPDLAAKVQLFVKGAALPSSFNGKTPSELLESGEWAWHDLGTAVQGAEDSLSVWTWNAKSSRWGVGNSCEVAGAGLAKTHVSIAAPTRWISAITFLTREAELQPRRMIAHIVNNSYKPLHISETPSIGSRPVVTVS